MRDGSIDDRNLYEVLLCILYALGNSCSNLIRLSKTIADDTVFITDDNDGSKAEVATSLSDLGHTVDSYKSVLEFEVRRLYSFYVCICHSPIN